MKNRVIKSAIISVLEKTLKRIWSNELAVAFCFSFALEIILYPTILLFLASPMIARNLTWTLEDPAVSTLDFIPGLNAVRYELLEHGNLLWSGLRNLGTPILGNEIQTAPLFPLPIAFIWLPSRYFWNAFVIVRLLLIGAGTFLIALRLMRLNRLAAMAFTIIFAYAVFVCRWINHPWQNGLLAGIWLIFFMGRAIALSREPWGHRRLLNSLGIAVSSYSLLTSGFPESITMMVLLCAFVITPHLIALAMKDRRAAGGVVLEYGLAGTSAAMIASFQLFALLEYISLAAPGFRNTNGLHQFSSFAEFLTMIALFQYRAPPGEMIQIFGLVPLAFFGIGVISRLVKSARLEVTDAIGFITIALYVLKCFPVWPAFNTAVGSIPVLRESWFTVYFFPIFLFGFAFYCAKGVEFTADSLEKQDWKLFVPVLWISLGCVAILAVAAGLRFHPVDGKYIVCGTGLLCILVALLTLFDRRNGFCRSMQTSHSVAILCGSIIALLVVECSIDKPAYFASYVGNEYHALVADEALGHAIVDAAVRHDVGRYNLREASEGGSFVQDGLATIDNGSPAILTRRAQLFRTSLFQTDWAGLMPLKSALVPDAYRLAGRNIVLQTDRTSEPHPNGLVPWGQLADTKISFDTASPGRAFVAARCRQAANPEQAAKLIKDEIDFRLGDVVVEDMTEAESALCSQLQSPNWRSVAVLEDQGDFVRLASVNGPVILTLNDSFYPGWTAHDRITGEMLPVKPANINFRSVFLPDARSYDVEFVYRPFWLVWAEILAATALVGWLIAVFVTVHRRKNTPAARLSEA